MQQNGLRSGIDDLINVFIFKHSFPVNDHLVPFDGNHLAGIFIHKILDPAFQHTCCQLAAHQLFQGGF